MVHQRNAVQNVRVGVGVFVIKDGKFLMLQRRGSHGEGTWSVPGGHLEYGETFIDTAKREVKEETDLDIDNIRFGAVTNDVFESENKHYVTVWMLSDWAGGKLRNMEPEKCITHAWCTFNDLPSPLFLPWYQLLDSEFYPQLQQIMKERA